MLEVDPRCIVESDDSEKSLSSLSPEMSPEIQDSDSELRLLALKPERVPVIDDSEELPRYELTDDLE